MIRNRYFIIETVFCSYFIWILIIRCSGYGIYKFTDLLKSFADEFCRYPGNYFTFYLQTICSNNLYNPLSANPTKWSNTLIGQQPTNCLSVFDHFVGLVVKVLISSVVSLCSKPSDGIS